MTDKSRNLLSSAGHYLNKAFNPVRKAFSQSQTENNLPLESLDTPVAHDTSTTSNTTPNAPDISTRSNRRLRENNHSSSSQQETHVLANDSENIEHELNEVVTYEQLLERISELNNTNSSSNPRIESNNSSSPPEGGGGINQSNRNTSWVGNNYFDPQERRWTPQTLHAFSVDSGPKRPAERNQQEQEAIEMDTLGEDSLERRCRKLAKIIMERMEEQGFQFPGPVLQALRKGLIDFIAETLVADKPKDLSHNTLMKELAKQRKKCIFLCRGKYVNGFSWDHKQKIMNWGELFVPRLAGIRAKRDNKWSPLCRYFYWEWKKAPERRNLRRIFDHQHIREDGSKKAKDEIKQLGTALLQIFEQLELWKRDPGFKPEEEDNSSKPDKFSPKALKISPEASTSKSKDKGKAVDLVDGKGNDPGGGGDPLADLAQKLRNIGLDAFPNVYDSLLEKVGDAYAMIYEHAELEIQIDEFTWNDNERGFRRIYGNRAKNAKEFLKKKLEALKQAKDALSDQNTTLSIGEDLMAVRFVEHPVQGKERWRVPLDGLKKPIEENAYLGGSAYDKKIEISFPFPDIPDKEKKVNDIYNKLLKEVFHLVGEKDKKKNISEEAYPYLWREIEDMYSGNSHVQQLYQFLSETELLNTNKPLDYELVYSYVRVHKQFFAKFEELKAIAVTKNWLTRAYFWLQHRYKLQELKEKANNVKIAEQVRAKFNQKIGQRDHLEECFATKKLATQISLADKAAKSYMVLAQESLLDHITQKFNLHVEHIEAEWLDWIGTKARGMTFAQWFNTFAHGILWYLEKHDNPTNRTNPSI